MMLHMSFRRDNHIWRVKLVTAGKGGLEMNCLDMTMRHGGVRDELFRHDYET